VVSRVPSAPYLLKSGKGGEGGREGGRGGEKDTGIRGYVTRGLPTYPAKEVSEVCTFVCTDST